MENYKTQKQDGESSVHEPGKTVKTPKSSGNKSFRKHNKLGYYRLMQRK